MLEKTPQPTATERLIYFIRERELVRQRREAGQPPPWTDDPILRVWSFCNVRREDDATTRWIAMNWREPHSDDTDLWFAMTVARFVNFPPTLAEMGYPVPWDSGRFLSVMHGRKGRGEQLYGGAYKIGGGVRMRGWDKAAFQVANLFDPLWRGRAELRCRKDDTLASLHLRLKVRFGVGEFMAAQIIADLKYVPPLINAPDWMTFAASGPGSRRGLNRVMERPVSAAWWEHDWRATLRRLHVDVTPELERIGIERLHAQDLQNCLCEYDKMERARLGEGRPKRRYTPQESRLDETPALLGAAL